jgi:two-component system, response regulator PdtaR
MTAQLDDELSAAAILITEDEYLLAMGVADELNAAGFRPIGPFPTVGQALLSLHEELPDAAVLDVELQGEDVTPIAELLDLHGVPFVVCSGLVDAEIDKRPALSGHPRISKPVDAGQMVKTLSDLIGRGGEE